MLIVNDGQVGRVQLFELSHSVSFDTNIAQAYVYTMESIQAMTAVLQFFAAILTVITASLLFAYKKNLKKEASFSAKVPSRPYTSAY